MTPKILHIDMNKFYASVEQMTYHILVESTARTR